MTKECECTKKEALEGCKRHGYAKGLQMWQTCMNSAEHRDTMDAKAASKETAKLNSPANNRRLTVRNIGCHRTPTVLQRALSYRRSRRRWKRAGCPTRPPERVADLFEICRTCECYRPGSDPKKGGHCSACGCNLSRTGHILNKLEWATEGCPLDEPKFSADTVSNGLDCRYCTLSEAPDKKNEDPKFLCDHPGHKSVVLSFCRNCPDFAQVPPGRSEHTPALPAPMEETQRVARKHNKKRYKARQNITEVGKHDPASIEPGPITDRTGRRPVAVGNLYYGASMFLILNGPSFGKLNHSMLDRRGILSMGVNNGACTYRPNLWIHGDPAQKFHWSIWSDPAILKFTPYHERKRMVRTASENGTPKPGDEQVWYQPGVLCYKRRRKFDPADFLTGDFCNGHNPEKYGGRWPHLVSTMLSAIRLCHYLGVFRVYLLGCDFYVPREGRGFHFEERKNSSPTSYDGHIPYLQALKPVFDEAGFEIYNCNSTSRLETFEYVSFEHAVREATVGIPDSGEIKSNGWYNKEKKNGTEAKRS